MHYAIRLVVLFFSVLASLATAGAQKRVALVIGNAKYEHIAGLPNVPNDAKAMEALFKAAKFDSVVVLHDKRIADLRKELLDFAEGAAGADVAVVFYAGHGIEVDRVNYLIPVDARLRSDLAVKDETISLDRVMELMEPARKLRVVILDACRENPFAKSMKLTAATRSVTRGLGRVEAGGANTLIAFATEPNAVAEDGTGVNSPFTAALVKHLVTPGLDLRIALGNVRDEVMASTSKKQRPYVTSSLGGGVISLGSAALVAPKPGVPAPLPSSAADRMWAVVKDTANIPALEAFRQQYGKDNPIYDRLAEGRVEELKRRQADVIIAPPQEKGPQQFSREKEASFSYLDSTEAVGRTRTFSGETTDLDGCASRCLAEGFCQAFSFNKETRFCYLIDHVVARARNPSFVSAIRHSPALSAQTLTFQQLETRFSLLHDTEVVGRVRTFSGETTDLDGCASRCLAEGFCQAFSFNKETRFCYLIDHVVARNRNPSFVSAIRRVLMAGDR